MGYIMHKWGGLISAPRSNECGQISAFYHASKIAPAEDERDPTEQAENDTEADPLEQRHVSLCSAQVEVAHKLDTLRGVGVLLGMTFHHLFEARKSKGCLGTLTKLHEEVMASGP